MSPATSDAPADAPPDVPPGRAEAEAAVVGRWAWRGTEHDETGTPTYRATYTLDIVSLAPGSPVSGTVLRLPTSPALDEQGEGAEEEGAARDGPERDLVLGVVARSPDGHIVLRLRGVDAHDPASARLEAGWVASLELHLRRGPHARAQWRLGGDAYRYPRDTPSPDELASAGRLEDLDDHRLARPCTILLGREHAVSKGEHAERIQGPRADEAAAVDPGALPLPLASEPATRDEPPALMAVTGFDARAFTPSALSRSVPFAQLADVLAPVRDRAYIYWSRDERAAIVQRLEALGGYTGIDYAGIVEREAHRAIERPLGRLWREHQRG